MKFLITSFFYILCPVFCLQAQPCKDLPDKFYAYSSAIRAIRAADFEYTDAIPDGSSSWIITAEYFSCDGNFGYFIFSTDKGNEYIHENVPKNLWNQFKQADSKGSFYDKHVKKRYRLIPDN